MTTVTVITTFSGPPGPQGGELPVGPSGNMVIDASGDLLGTQVSGGANGDGAVFEVANTGSGYASAPTTLTSFDGTDGQNASGGLIADAAGNLYGVTQRGGANGDGTIFELSATADGYASTPTLLASFDGNNGVGPTNQLVMDSAGDLFGVAETGGTNATMFELAKTADGYASTPTALAQYNAPFLPGPLIMDSAGDLFSAALSKGGPSTGSVIEIANTSDGYASTPTTLATFSSADGTPAGALVADAAGNLFGLTDSGGANSAGEIFEIAKTAGGYASTATVLASFPSGNLGDGSLLIDGADNLFITRLPLGGPSGAELFELPKTDGIYASTVTALASLPFSTSAGLTADSAGNLFGATDGFGQLGGYTNSTLYEVTGTGYVPATASTGETLGANDTAGQQLIGTPLNDTFYAGHNSVVMTGDGGANTFIFQYLAWNAGSITDFNTASDKLDLSALLSGAGYTGSNPVGDGYLQFAADGQGDTQVYVDPQGPSTTTPILVTTLDHVSPASITPANYGYSSGGGIGETLTANDTPGQQLTGTPYNDTFYAGHNSVVMTGDGGADTFIFQYLPWNAGSITDFNTAADKLDLSALLSGAGYTGSNPVADGYLQFVSDGSGDTHVIVDPQGPGTQTPILVTTLDGVSPSSITPADYGFGSSSGGGSTVDDSQPNYTVPNGVTNVVLTGSASQSVTANNQGDTITSNDYGSTIIGGTGNDTLIAGHSADMLTGNGGDDSFVFSYLPWNAGAIADFNTATDVLNLKGIFAGVDYTGSNPVADGYLTFAADGHGDTQVIVSPQGPSTQIPILVTTLDHIDPSAIHSGDYLFA
ncbi:MAG TPA: choice-of-anchor tandem repeat GloVer-containing protein [Stellaceae bacterium]|jgi:uncharacterized repeat protein (TIGR03803 family)|nr:choice-of-anchor tandem repeat GloVer-containing protein [Stellaceae bacterium]